jgi:small-conductance mechanosensitive channel/CRP-like cAMP-binding protein
LGRAVLLVAGTLILGICLMFFFRNLLQRLRLGPAFVVGVFACAIYAAAWGLKPARMWILNDPVNFWIIRLFAAAMLFVLLRVIDRLALVPILTRRGKVTMPRFFHQIVNVVLAVFTILLFGSSAFGWDIDKFLAGSAVVSIVLGLALQESLGNFFSGLVMQASPPFTLGDWIVCGAHEGRVVDMTWRAVTLHTNDDNFIVIPNGNIAKSEIMNFYVPTVATARYIKVGLDYDLPPADAIDVLRAAALEATRVLKSPEPVVYLDEFADSSVNYVVKFWIDHPPDDKEAESEVRVNLWYRLRERGYNIPFPVRTVEHVSLHQKARQIEEESQRRYLKAIQSVPLLAPLSADQKHQLSRSASDLLLGEGQILFRQNDAGDSFYIICKGQVQVLVYSADGKEERQVASLGPGDFFGEMSALTGQPRTASIRARTAVTLVEIEKEDLLAIFQADPSIMEKISEVVARRNAEREAIAQGATGGPTAEVVVRQQKTLLGRMMSFFRLGTAA